MSLIKVKGCLNGFHLKIIALFTMTLDHLAAYQVLTDNAQVNDVLRIIGRIAAPLFLFMIVEGLHHTRSKPKYILRLYVAGVVIAIANKIIISAVGSTMELLVSFGNILPTFFYVALFVYCLECIIQNKRNIKTVLLGSCCLLLPFVIVALDVGLSERGLSHIWNIIEIFFPSIFTVEYSIVFVAIGVIWYFINNKYINCGIFAMVSLLCLVVPETVFFMAPTIYLQPIYFNVFELFVNTQWCMILAIPFILLYNGEKGRGFKYFFYLYYPLHQYLLFLLAIIL